MPEWLNITLRILVLILLLLAVAAGPFVVALLFGLAWGILATLAVGAGLFWFAGKLGMDGGFDVLMFGGVAAVIGMVGGAIGRLL